MGHVVESSAKMIELIELMGRDDSGLDPTKSVRIPGYTFTNLDMLIC